ncbi:DUF2798 domain-containing protein [Lactobacillus delbrueckii]|uniref:DUF2798 domain-containing protein n=1 Tax=Lactobacillus delbrueckii TaxID=1584 RepID=UPI0022E1DE60|nr:DUF2798 domain-containing protein [Lactobacillus delbrueckii]
MSLAFVMVYAMICYNIALTIGGMRDAVLLDAFREIMIMWPVAIILEMFVFEKPVVYLTQRLITPETPILLIILIRCSITVCLMCPTMSLIATALFKNFQAAGFIGTWLQTAVINFPMAIGWQIFLCGPAVRFLFRTIFRKDN